MSKTNHTSRLGTLEDHRPLADSELDAVSGGLSYEEVTFEYTERGQTRGAISGTVVAGWEVKPNKRV